MEFLAEFRALGNDFAEGFRHSPAYVAALLGQTPLETAQHVARQVVACLVELGCDGAYSDSGPEPHLGFVHEQTHERSHGRHALGDDLREMAPPVRSGKPGFDLYFQRTKVSHGFLLGESRARRVQKLSCRQASSIYRLI